MYRINLVGWDNGSGLSHDLTLLKSALERLGHHVDITSPGPQRKDGVLSVRLMRLRRLLAAWLRGRRPSPRYDLNIMLEHVRPAYFALARRNVLIPNPEWFSQRDAAGMRGIDAVFAKTRTAAKLFSELGYRTVEIGFVSCDWFNPEITRQPHFLHLAGVSRMKGTDRLLALWRRHPNWPKLTVIRRGGPAEAPASNIEYITNRIASEDSLNNFRNSYRFHLCLSEAEGWGHYIVEAMGCAAIVVTCDAPPMNEFVQADRGCLVAARQEGMVNSAPRWLFDETALEEKIETLISMPERTQAEMGLRARQWFTENGEHFASRLSNALEAMLAPNDATARKRN